MYGCISMLDVGGVYTNGSSCIVGMKNEVSGYLVVRCLVKICDGLRDILS
jgi:hypothetical protein